MNEETDSRIPLAEPVEPDSERALAGVLEVKATGNVPLTRNVIDLYQSYLQTMWSKIAPPLGPTLTAYVFRSIILQNDQPKGSLHHYFDITEQGISLRRLERELGRARSAELMNELVTLLPQLCDVLDSLACRILAGPPDHKSGGDTGPLAGNVQRANLSPRS